MVKRIYYTVFVVLLLCTYMYTTMLADDNDWSFNYPRSKTVLLEQGEEYIPDNHGRYDAQSAFCRDTIVDSTSSISDTLSGVAVYKLFFDTTNLAAGKELIRTEDFLFRIYRLNREVKAYCSDEMANAPQEIVVADSLLRAMLSSKRIWMEWYSPSFTYFLPFHTIYVEFTIIPQYKTYRCDMTTLCYAGDTIYDPKSTPIYLGKTLYCSKIVHYSEDVLCDKEPNLKVYTPYVKDTIKGVLQHTVSFDISNAAPYQELPVIDISEVTFVKPRFENDTLAALCREELLTWHWWLGKYINPLTLFSKQAWASPYIIIPIGTKEE